MRCSNLLALIAMYVALAAHSSAAEPHPIRPLAINGIDLPGLNGSPYRMAINNSGEWAMQTMPPQGDRLVRNGQLLYPNDGTTLGLNSIMSVSLSNTGHVSSVIYVPGNYPGTIYDRYTVFYDQRPILRPTAVTRSSLFPAGSYWSAIHDAATNDRGEVFVTGDITTNPSGNSTQVVGKFTVNASGQVTDEQILFRDSDQLPDGSGATYAANPPRHSWEWEINNAGQRLMTFTLFPSSGGSSQALYRDTTQLIKGGMPAPINGHVYGYTRAAHLNDLGDWSVVTTLDSSSTASLVVFDGQKVIQVGDSLANGYHLTTLKEQTYVGNDGAVFWAGWWDDPSNTHHFGIFRNQELLVQEGVTTVGTATITALNNWGSGGAFAVSDDGQLLSFGATLSNGPIGLFQMTLPEPAMGLLFSVLSLTLVRRPLSRKRR